MLRYKSRTTLNFTGRRLLQTQTPPPTSQEYLQLAGAYKSLKPRPTPLSTLLSFGSPLTPSSIVLSASYVLEELPRRLVQRVRSMEALPYIVGMNPFIARTLESYRQTFQDLATAPPVVDAASNIEFTRRLENLVRSHANDIPVLARGFQECAKYMRPEVISSFLDGAIRSRIAIRFIAEQHIALTRALKLHPGTQTVPSLEPTHSRGVVDSECSPFEMVNLCTTFVHELCVGTFGMAPDVTIDGMTDVTFPYVPVHVEYVLTEILKNAFRATVENHQRKYGIHSTGPLPQVQITIAYATLPPVPPSVETSFSDNEASTAVSTRKPPSYLSIRVRDQGGGVDPKDLQRIFSYAFTTARGVSNTEDSDLEGGPYAMQAVGGLAGIADTGSMDTDGGDAGGLFGEIVGKGLQTGLGTIAGLGYGLPMARLYASYFGGSLELISMHGHGTDVFIKFRCLDENTNIEV
ncbi:SubName: Full=Related to branched-chain alpha-ketoacid dehydrogenase kinase, mitochondrial {ECO:0000313/EMBL:CCA77951.1} [Serendipita indica DSM 11827]|nr:SubName: Full=Related to branched-chain alpha-ketoacid dehydrogenase kinase, mitochondrial {ECO:0000313/EMBL:CCA77951.1} [Serendipita indica DSM 11827]